jgi:hypothetical protein
MPRHRKQEPTVPFSFRLSQKDRIWLETFANSLGVEVAICLRWGIEVLRQYSEGGCLLPIDLARFAQTMKLPKPPEIAKENCQRKSQVPEPEQ